MIVITEISIENELLQHHQNCHMLDFFTNWTEGQYVYRSYIDILGD